MLEPLFRCNLACAGCGKIDYPDPILNKRLSVDECLAAADECGAPMVAIPGGEPLLHKEIGEIVEGLVARKKYVSLCTNALLLEKKLHLFKHHNTRNLSKFNFTNPFKSSIFIKSNRSLVICSNF